MIPENLRGNRSIIEASSELLLERLLLIDLRSLRSEIAKSPAGAVIRESNRKRRVV
jgi:hypothetical protein